MAECQNKKYQQMLHAYELGMLTEVEQEELELHLMNCSDCFDRLQKMKEASSLMQSDPEIREIVNTVVNNSRTLSEGPTTKKQIPSRHWIKTLVPVTLAAAAILLTMILKDWQFDIRPSQPAMAFDNRLIVLYFENQVDQPDSSNIGGMLTSLLITDLSESSFLNIVSSQRLHDLVKQVNPDTSRQLDKTLASSVAQAAGAQWMLTGAILQLSPKALVTYQISDVASGEVIASHSLSGTLDSGMFSLVDDMTTIIKSQLSLPTAAIKEHDRNIADMTTHSPEAYKHYIEGVELINRLYYDDALKSWKNAVRLDSTFALAWYALTLYEDDKLISKAIQYIDKASALDQKFIRSTAAKLKNDIAESVHLIREILDEYLDDKRALNRLGVYYWSQDQRDSALVCFRAALQSDPTYRLALNYMVAAYDELGDFDSTLVWVERYIAVAPDEPNPYDTKGRMLLKLGQKELAAESFRTALKIEPEFVSSALGLASLYLDQRKFDDAEQLYQRLALSEHAYIRGIGRCYLALPYLRQGKFKQSLTILNDAIAADRMEQTVGWNGALKYLLKIHAFMELGLTDSISSTAETGMISFFKDSTDRKKCYQIFFLQALADVGAISRATEITDQLEEFIQPWHNNYCYVDIAQGCMYLATGDFDQAVIHFEIAVTAVDDYFAPYMYARALQQAGQLTEAANQYESLLGCSDIWSAFFSVWTVKSHYYLGQTYESLGQTEKAVAQYEIFLEIWQEADPGITATEDARSRLKRLKTNL